jgi:hypothetical protein
MLAAAYQGLLARDESVTFEYGFYLQGQAGISTLRAKSQMDSRVSFGTEFRRNES